MSLCSTGLGGAFRGPRHRAPIAFRGRWCRYVNHQKSLGRRWCPGETREGNKELAGASWKGAIIDSERPGEAKADGVGRLSTGDCVDESQFKVIKMVVDGAGVCIGWVAEGGGWLFQLEETVESSGGVLLPQLQPG